MDAMIIFNYPYMGSMLVPLLGGLLWKGATRKGAFAAAIVGGIIGVISFLIGIPGPPLWSYERRSFIDDCLSVFCCGSGARQYAGSGRSEGQNRSRGLILKSEMECG